MQADILKSDKGALILYDAAQAGKIHEHIFTPAYWRTLGALGDPLGGRGSAWRIRTDSIDWVLRLYRRGGLPGKFVHDWYFYSGLESTRPWREWRLLARMRELDLPVPKPVAARITRAGLGYYGAIITETLPGESLAKRMTSRSMNDAAWRATGRTIRRMHDAGVWHADLNAHNILLADESDASHVYLLDFDRGRMRAQDAKWRQANLDRLRRSLDKVAAAADCTAIVPGGWAMLKAGYKG